MKSHNCHFGTLKIMKSIFTDKNVRPTHEDLKKRLAYTLTVWEDIEEFTKRNCPSAKAEWHFSGEKFGWSYRIKDNRRVLIYLLPRDRFFKGALVFGKKAVDQIVESTISAAIKAELMAAKQFAEGRGIRIEIKDASAIEDIKELIKIKIAT